MHITLSVYMCCRLGLRVRVRLLSEPMMLCKRLLVRLQYIRCSLISAETCLTVFNWLSCVHGKTCTHQRLLLELQSMIACRCFLLFVICVSGVFGGGARRLIIRRGNVQRNTRCCLACLSLFEPHIYIYICPLLVCNDKPTDIHHFGWLACLITVVTAI